MLAVKPKPQLCGLGNLRSSKVRHLSEMTVGTDKTAMNEGKEEKAGITSVNMTKKMIDHIVVIIIDTEARAVTAITASIAHERSVMKTVKIEVGVASDIATADDKASLRIYCAACYAELL
jgi:hypothetical protein